MFEISPGRHFRALLFDGPGKPRFGGDDREPVNEDSILALGNNELTI